MTSLYQKTQADSGASAVQNGGFVRWYWQAHPRLIVRGYVRVATATWKAGSVVFLLKTLFAPWKKISDGYPAKGFDLEKIASTFFLNMTTRCIGAVIRICAIIAGLAMQVIVVLLFAMYLALWVFLPLVILFSFFTYVA